MKIVISESQLKKLIGEDHNVENGKPSEESYKRSLHDIRPLIGHIAHEYAHLKGYSHDDIPMLKKEIMNKVMDGDDEVLDMLWNSAGSLVLRNAINIITFYTKK